MLNQAASPTPLRHSPRPVRTPLYTPQERARRDASVWTLIQGVLAPVQFVGFRVSLGLVLRFLATGAGEQAAALSVLVKTLTLYAIMVTGCIWEKVVVGRYLFAPAFFWEDVFSILVLALHTAYLVALFTGALTADQLMALALAAYVTYVINAGQFLWKLRLARLDQAGSAGELKDSAGHASGPFDGRAQGSPLPGAASADPALAGSSGTCGQASSRYSMMASDWLRV